MPAGKLARLLGHLGLQVTPGGVSEAIARAARRCQPTYQALVRGVRDSPVVAPDETGWRVGGARAWLWAFAGAQVTVYRIAHGRGYSDAAAVLGFQFAPLALALPVRHAVCKLGACLHLEFAERFV